MIAEATKLQSQVLESIIGKNNDRDIKMNDQLVEDVQLKNTSEIMNDAEKQIKIHKTEKETFSKGIASIIYDNQDSEAKDEYSDYSEKNASVDEVIETAATIEANEIVTKIEDQKSPDIIRDVPDNKHDVAAEKDRISDNRENKRSESPSNKKFMNGRMSKNGPRFTVIGGQKVDLNSDKPQYLKLTLEQIQQLALQQRSGIM